MPSYPHSSPPVSTTQTSRFSSRSASSSSATESAVATPLASSLAPGNDLRELDVDEREDRDEEDEGGEELEQRDAFESSPAARSPRIGTRIASDQKSSRGGPKVNGSARMTRVSSRIRRAE